MNIPHLYPLSLSLPGWGVRGIGLLVLATGLSSCGSLALDLPAASLFRRAVSAERIHTHTGRDITGAIVYLEGTVSDRVPLIDAQVYQLQDSTGAIWVLTDDLSLASGEQVRIRGKVRYAEFSSEQPQGEFYIEEQRQVERSQPTPSAP